MTMKYFSDYISSYQEYGGFDVKLVAQNQTLLAHRLILSAGSLYLKRLLKGFELDEEPAVIILSEFTFNEVESLVKMIYNTADLKDLGHVPQIFQELRFKDMGFESGGSRVKVDVEEEVEAAAADTINLRRLPRLAGENRDEEEVGDTKDLIKDLIAEEEIKQEMILDNGLNIQQAEAMEMDEDDKDELIHSDSDSQPRKYPKKEKKFSCTDCDYFTDRPTRLETHRQRKHREKPTLDRDKFKCSECDYITDQAVRLERHKQRLHSADYVKKVMHRCDECDYFTYVERRLGKHKAKKHQVKQEKFDCDMCDFSTEERGKIIQHREAQHQVFQHENVIVGKATSDGKVKKKKWECDECKFVSDRPKKLIYHKKIKHQGGYKDTDEDVWYHCPYDNCDKKYRLNEQLSQHKSVNHRGRLFYCDKCSYSCKFKPSLEMHIMKKHAGVRFMCERCAHEAPNPQALAYHIKIVHEGLTFPCDMCEFVGTTYSRMAHHKTREHGTQIFMCEQCSSTFKDRGALNKHVKKVHSTLQLQCNFCDFTTKLEYCLKRHKESHHKDRLVLEQARPSQQPPPPPPPLNHHPHHPQQQQQMPVVVPNPVPPYAK